MFDLYLEKHSEIYIRVQCNFNIAYELNDFFSFYAKNYKFMPKYKAGIWDGRIKLFNIKTGLIYVGLLEKLIYFAQSRDYKFDADPDLFISNEKKHFDVMKYNPPFQPYDYQQDAINIILNKKRRLVLSPTSSGKSFIIYGAIRHLLDQGKRVLLVVPTTSLVEQMVKDFSSYNWREAESMCHKIYSGKEKTNEDSVVVTTWQSVYKLGKDWFNPFDAIFVDEAHLAQAESIKSIMEKAENATYRVGLTGTIDDTQAHKLILQGLFGKVYSTIKTSELMERGLVASLKIEAIVMNHSDEDKKIVSKLPYQGELDTIISNPRRNNFIVNLGMNVKGNTLVLFNYVSKHGSVLYKMFQDLNKDNKKQIFFVHGDTSTETREKVREISETYNNVVIVASYGTFSTGINIKNLDNVIFAHPYKSKIKNLQSIGRVLRKAQDDAKATLYDIADDYCWKSKSNTTYNHLKERLSIYEKEQFDYTIRTLDI